MLSRLNMSSHDYTSGSFSPWINFAFINNKKFKEVTSLSFLGNLQFTSDQQKIMRSVHGAANFRFDGEFRNYAWSFKLHSWTLIYFCSKKGSSLEVAHESGVSPYDENFDDSVLDSLVVAIKCFNSSLNGWLNSAVLTNKTEMMQELKSVDNSLSVLKQQKDGYLRDNNGSEYATKEDAIKAGYVTIRI